MKIIQIHPWRDGLLALDDQGNLWFGSPQHERLGFITWQRLSIPREEDLCMAGHRPKLPHPQGRDD